MSAQIAPAQLSEPNHPRNTLFTCLACHVAFPTSDRQRAHYRTDWHKYNLKRKIANLTPLNAEQFAQKVLAQQAAGLEEQERQGLIYECAVCRKSYYSENAFNNHVQSRKHKEMEQMEDEDQQSTMSIEEKIAQVQTIREQPRGDDASLECLFCHQAYSDFDTNLTHMTRDHGFFLPDTEYLADPQGLIRYLSAKIRDDHLCLYCNGRGKAWKSLDAVRAHMVDVGHCKMAYDETEDPDQLLKYYDFGDLSSEPVMKTTNVDQEIVLPNGTQIGHRRLWYQYRQRTRPEAPVSDETQVSTRIDPSLPRRERRHLAITSGQEQSEQAKQGIREAKIRQRFQDSMSIKHNMTNTLRARNQNPI